MSGRIDAVIDCDAAPVCWIPRSTWILDESAPRAFTMFPTAVGPPQRVAKRATRDVVPERR